MTKRVNPIAIRLPNQTLWHNNQEFFSDKNLKRIYITIKLVITKTLKKQKYKALNISLTKEKNIIVANVYLHQKGFNKKRLFLKTYRPFQITPLAKYQIKLLKNFQKSFYSRILLPLKIEKIIQQKMGIRVKIKLIPIDNKKLSKLMLLKERYREFIIQKKIGPRRYRMPWMRLKTKHQIFKGAIIALYLGNAELLCNIIKQGLKTRRNKNYFLQVLIKMIKNLEPNNFHNVNGLQIALKGKFLPKGRRTITKINHFSPTFQRLSNHISTDLRKAETKLLTKRGMVSLKVAITYTKRENFEKQMAFTILKNKNTRKRIQLGETKARLQYGNFGIMTTENGCLTKNQVEAIRKILKRTLERKSKIWVNLSFNKPLTKKPKSARMGKGKGEIYGLITLVKKGSIIFEFKGVHLNKCLQAIEKINKKVHLKTTFITKKN